MTVVELKRGKDTWLLEVGDVENEADAEAKALKTANGDGDLIKPGNGKPGWTVVRYHDSINFDTLRGVSNEDIAREQAEREAATESEQQ